MGHLRITVGLPVVNEPQGFVKDAITSVLGQTCQDWELIIVADGSSATTLSFLGRFRDERIRIIRHREPRGLAASLNEIARQAQGEYLARMDADDIMMPSRLEHQLALLESSGADLVSGRAVIIDEDDDVLAVSPVLPADVDVRSMFRSTPFIHPTVFARTEWFRAHPYDEALLRCQDKALWITASGDTAYRRDPAPVLYHRVSRDLNPAKYSRSATYERKIIRAYGPAEIGGLRTAGALAKSWAAQILVYIASRARRGHLILERRYSRLAEQERSEWQSALAPITGRADAGQASEGSA